tara:strand:+ start:423 stop:548 length:126 start_codon:yes stop_codon:yes gene_type:complete
LLLHHLNHLNHLVIYLFQQVAKVEVDKEMENLDHSYLHSHL